MRVITQSYEDTIMKLDSDAYARIIDSLHDGLYFVDTNRVIIYWNKASERITGFTAAEVIGRSCADNILTHVDCKGTNLCLGPCPLAATIADGKDREAEIYMHHKDGHRIPVQVRVSPLKDSAGKIIGGIELFSDISNMQANALRIIELEKMALLDNLTQLANRNYLERELHVRFEEYKRQAIPFGLLSLDIDHFKRVNDSYGHDIGDTVLRFAANTFVANSRPFDLYGRWGGDEFLGIIRNITIEDLTDLGNRMRILVNSSYIEHKKKKIEVTVSIGATLVNEHDSIDTLLKRADTMLYKSKKKGRNRLTIC